MKALVPPTIIVSLAMLAGIAGAAASPPANQSLPSIGGTPVENQILRVRLGAWVGTPPLAFRYQWRRCGTQAGNCGAIAGATARTYAATSVDVGCRLRALVTASNAEGSSSAVSRPTALIRARGATPPPPPPPPPPPGPAGQILLADGKVSIPVSSVALPQRLVISNVVFSPSPVRSRAPFSGRFRVTDTRGFVVRDAIVLALGVPYSRILVESEQTTGTDGWATFQFRPTAQLPLQRGSYLVVFLRARKAGDSLLSGVSTRRLVQVALGPPA